MKLRANRGGVDSMDSCTLPNCAGTRHTNILIRSNSTGSTPNKQITPHSPRFNTHIETNQTQQHRRQHLSLAWLIRHNIAVKA